MGKSQLWAAAIAASTLLGASGAQAVDWNGFYLGVQSGYDFDGYVPLQGVVGFNFSQGSGLVLGVEAAFGAYFDAGGGSGDGTEGYIAGRLGAAMGDALVYGMGGVSFVDADTGGVAGAGVEFAIQPHLTLRGQGLYYFGGDNFGQATLGLIWRP
jgi:hypothetical protein